MAIEYHIITLPQNEQFSQAVEQLTRDGWQIVPGTVAQVTYFLMRDSSAHAAHAGMKIDESKIEIIRGSR